MKLAELPQLAGGLYYVDYRALSWAANTIVGCFGFSPAVHVLIQELVAQLPENTSLAVDFSFIEELSWGNDDPFDPSIDVTVGSNRSLMFIGLPRHLSLEFQQASKMHAPMVIGNASDRDFGLLWGHERFPDHRKAVSGEGLLDLHRRESKEVERIIAETFELFPKKDPESRGQLLPNTPILSNGYFNAQHIISDNFSFMRVTFSLARLFARAEKSIVDELIGDEFDNVRFLALSLRASPFVGALSVICNRGFNIFAPGINSKVLSDYVANPLLPRIAYVFVADFIVGGVELRVAEAFAAHRQSTIAHCLCLGSFLPASAFLTLTRIEPLVLLSTVRDDLRFEMAR